MSRSQLSRANVLADTVQTFLGSVVHQATSPEDMADALEGFRPGYKAPDGPAVLVDEGWAIDRIDEEERAVHIAQARVADLERQLAHEQTLRKSAEERVETLERELSEAEAGELRQAARVNELECLIWHHEWELNYPVCTRCRTRNGHIEGCQWGQAAANHRQRVEPKAALRGEEVAPC